jgi:hypothetical protein
LSWHAHGWHVQAEARVALLQLQLTKQQHLL